MQRKLVLVTAGLVGDHNGIRYPRHLRSVDREVEIVQNPLWYREPETNHPAFQHDIILGAEFVAAVYRSALVVECPGDLYVVYLPKTTSQMVLEIAGKLPVDKLRLVMCGCSLDEKMAAVAAAGFDPSIVLARNADCSGAMMLERMMQSFLALGELC